VLIPQLRCDYFNPVVDDWTPECQVNELRERESADIVLYVITPLMTGVYSIAELIDDSNKRSAKTIFCYLTSDRLPQTGETISFTSGQVKSLRAVGDMVVRNGGTWVQDFHQLSALLNEMSDATTHPVRGW
jgi:hypothetical protein